MAQNTGNSVGSVLGGAIGTAVGGPIGGIAGSALGSVAGGLVSAAPSFVKTEAEKYNEEELRKLKRRQELGALGLTEAEKQQAYLGASAGLNKAASDVRALQSGLASSLATGAGSALTRTAMAEENLLAQKAAVEQKIMEDDLKRRNEETERIRNMEADAAAYRDTRKEAKIGAAASAALTGMGEVDEAIVQLRKLRGATPSPAQIETFMKLTGLDKNQVEAALGQIARDPTTASLISGILGTGTTGIIK